MLEALGITHVVSVGETLISCQHDCDPMYGKIGANALVNAYQDGRIEVYVAYLHGADKVDWISLLSGMTGMIPCDLPSLMLVTGSKKLGWMVARFWSTV